MAFEAGCRREMVTDCNREHPQIPNAGVEVSVLDVGAMSATLSRNGVFDSILTTTTRRWTR